MAYADSDNESTPRSSPEIDQGHRYQGHRHRTRNNYPGLLDNLLQQQQQQQQQSSYNYESLWDGPVVRPGGAHHHPVGGPGATVPVWVVDVAIVLVVVNVIFFVIIMVLCGLYICRCCGNQGTNPEMVARIKRGGPVQVQPANDPLKTLPPVYYSPQPSAFYI